MFHEMGRERSFEGLRVKLGKQGYEITTKTLMAWSKLHDWNGKIAYANRHEVEEIRHRSAQHVQADLRRLDETVESLQAMSGFVSAGMKAIAKAMDPESKAPIKIKSISDVTALASAAAQVARAVAEIRRTLVEIAPMGAMSLPSTPADDADEADKGAPLEGEVLPPALPVVPAVQQAPQLEAAIIKFRAERRKTA